jgi:hypothetical protein
VAISGEYLVIILLVFWGEWYGYYKAARKASILS